MLHRKDEGRGTESLELGDVGWEQLLELLTRQMGLGTPPPHRTTRAELQRP